MNEGYVGVLQEKQRFRELFTQYRKSLSATAKRQTELDIIVRLLSSEQYNNAKTVFTYVSLEHEIDTLAFIRAALANGKTVACPRCGEEKGQMEFYIIESTDDLQKGAYGVLEPVGDRIADASLYNKSICVVPGLGFDASGHRLGYGQGYYDRFLSNYTGVKIGLCYSNCVKFNIPHESFDIPMDCIITENYMRQIKAQRPS